MPTAKGIKKMATYKNVAVKVFEGDGRAAVGPDLQKMRSHQTNDDSEDAQNRTFLLPVLTVHCYRFTTGILCFWRARHAHVCENEASRTRIRSGISLPPRATSCSLRNQVQAVSRLTPAAPRHLSHTSEQKNSKYCTLKPLPFLSQNFQSFLFCPALLCGAALLCGHCPLPSSLFSST